LNSRPRRRLAGILALDDFEAAARRHLPRPVFGYVAGAAETDWTLADNRRAFAEYGFLPRMLVDVSKRTARTTLFEHAYSAPFGIAPLGIAALYAYRGDLVLAAAAAQANVPMVMSGSSLIRLEDVAAASSSTWFQAYLPGDEKAIVALIERVARAGFRTLVVTVDSQVAGNRENNIRAGFSTPLKPTLRLAWDGVTHPRWRLWPVSKWNLEADLDEAFGQDQVGERRADSQWSQVPRVDRLRGVPRQRDQCRDRGRRDDPRPRPRSAARGRSSRAGSCRFPRRGLRPACRSPYPPSFHVFGAQSP